MYADIIIEISHEKLDRPFQYRIPEKLEGSIEPGSYVEVPFGKGGRTIKGYVVNITDKAEIEEERIKDITALAVVSKGEEVKSSLIALAAWMKHNYGGTLIQSLKTVLPVRSTVKGKVRRLVYLNMDIKDAAAVHAEMIQKHQVARARVLAGLMDEDGADATLICDKLHVNNTVLNALEKAGHIRIEANKEYRKPDIFDDKKSGFVDLNIEQQIAVRTVQEDMDRGEGNTYLVHGVTGSGKTEVYIEIIADVIKRGKQAIVLIPEISLTYQTVMRFYRRFGERVSYMHSKLSAGERYDQWERASKGLIDIMIGPRSALFTPFEHLGVIIIDEEHEGSYKAENMPRYHAREVALQRARMSGASVILGSATPSVDSYYRASVGEYKLIELKNRAKGSALPKVDIIDMREELVRGNRSMFSDRLRELIEDRLNAHRQIMLFLNRRGFAGFVSCRKCGYVYKCPHCDVSLSAHKNGKLLCHYCGYETRLEKTCPKCSSKLIGGMKAGTEKVEIELKKLYPEARILRMDGDTTKNKGDYDRILKDFSDEKADILVGTQMIVKGHDFPKVTLVGILAADMSLYAPNYRSQERTFDLITQAAGRAGRDREEGAVVIQTYSPDNYSIIAGGAQDYTAFYEQEFSYRKLLAYPPLEHMLKVLIESPDEAEAGDYAEKAASVGRSHKEVETIGPADDVLSKLKDIYRKTVYIKCKEYETLAVIKDEIEEERRRNGIGGSRIQFDFDPL
ncbi:MAG: primosomal protein N' [Lachnospiraceae bacterium]|nr:primosomal protein N' [Lachnospiraceae bacterium]